MISVNRTPYFSLVTTTSPRAISFLLAMMIYLFVVRPIVQWVTDTDVSDAQLLQQLPKTVGELEREFDQNPNQLPSNASRLLSANSEKAVQLMRSWMSQA